MEPKKLIDIFQGKKILVVDDLDGSRYSISAALKRVGATFIATDSGEVGLNLLKNNSFDLIDIRMSHQNLILDLCREIRKRGITVPIIVLSSYMSLGVVNKLIELCVLDIISLPCKMSEIILRIIRAFKL